MIGESASEGGARPERRGRGRAGEAEFAFPLAVSGQERAGQGGVGDVVGSGLLAGKRRVALTVVRAEPAAMGCGASPPRRVGTERFGGLPRGLPEGSSAAVPPRGSLPPPSAVADSRPCGTLLLAVARWLCRSL